MDAQTSVELMCMACHRCCFKVFFFNPKLAHPMSLDLLLEYILKKAC